MKYKYEHWQWQWQLRHGQRGHSQSASDSTHAVADDRVALGATSTFTYSDFFSPMVKQVLPNISEDVRTPRRLFLFCRFRGSCGEKR